MRKNIYTLLAIGLFAFASCKREAPESMNGLATGILIPKAQQANVPQGDPIDAETLGNSIKGVVARDHDFRWQNAELKELWSAMVNSDHVVAIGYQPAEFKNIDQHIHEINVREGAFKATHDALIQLVLEKLTASLGHEVELQDILVEDDAVLPILTLRFTDKETLTALYNLQNVRYIEPIGYWPESTDERSSSGCSGSTYAINTNDYTTITPAAKLPWNFNNLNVPAAWNIAQGQGITIGLIDGGISSAQPLIGSDFNNGASNVGRTIATGYSYGTTAYTTCTHGTSMCGQAVGPRNANGATTGVAYKSNLYFIRGCNDVVLDESAELTGVKNGLITLGNTSAVRIISMSIGTPFYSSALLDGVNYAYNKGKMIFSAAGTSFSWTSWWGVIYPAAYSNCIAITGGNENGNTCSDCHDGSEVKFTIVMERNGNTNRNSLSLPLSGTSPSYIGGSSCATSTAAGVAALVWSVKPTLTREQVYTCLKNTSQYYPGVSSYNGYGNLNAAAAAQMAAGM